MLWIGTLRSLGFDPDPKQLHYYTDDEGHTLFGNVISPKKVF